ncbi:hypothetical protein CPB83DRAFT_836028 [Crepidotus variabilis]|uniref:Uncharacterized protein n=1 Tax=Crepidotus variabilis TaxID=179855 RepID=A0A9P6EEL9_9AGAR|nr:hypothetical protein CPB83DRAFT_836028 [Crepidotus variabilis]
MSKRAVIVDDTDPSIKYVGESWKADRGSRDSVGNYGSPFQSTLHGTDTSASLSFHFSGTSITVYGSNTVLNDSGVFDPQWECFIDNQNIGASYPYAIPENNWNFCGGSSLIDGPHTLTLNVSIKSQVFWFDRIEYNPSSTVSLENSNIRIEANDPDLQFGKDWKLGGDTNLTQTNGSAFNFEFTGVSISLFSYFLVAYPGTSTTGSYTIDGSSPQTFTLTGHPDDATTTAYDQKVFETLTLPMGRHNLSVVYHGNEDTTPLTFHYLVAENGTNSSTHGLTSTSAVLGPTSNIPAPTHAVHVPTKKSSIGAIVGGVVAGVGVIIITLVIIFLRRRRRSNENNVSARQFEPFQHRPYHQSSRHSSVPAYNSYIKPAEERTHILNTQDRGRINSNHIALSSRNLATRPPTYFSNQTLLNQSIFGKTPETPQRDSQHFRSGMDSIPPRVARHEDGRISPSEGTVDLPPRYTP